MGVQVKQWKGAWWIFINTNGQRKAKRVGAGPSGKKAAELAANQMQAQLALGNTSIFQPAPAQQAITVQDYALEWLRTHASQVCKFSTVRGYEVNLRRHVFPVLGAKSLAALERADCRTLIVACREKGLSPKSLENICRTLSSVLTQAVEDKVLAVNPAFRLGRYYRKADHPKPEIRPLTREEAAWFLAQVQEYAPREYPLFLCALRTGMRLGELLGLHWGDVDFHGRFIEVRRNLVAGRLTTPKNGMTRRVDMSAQLTQVLRETLTVRKEETLRQGWKHLPDWMFCNEAGKHLDGDNLRHRVFHRVLAKAGLRRVRLHDLRHTFASLLIQQGESLAYVRDQLGHASIQLTVDTYGHLIPGANRQAVDKLDDATPAQPAKEKGLRQAP
jgi:integrase